MANANLSPLIPIVYRAMDMVARESVGLINAVARNSTLDRVAKDQTVTIPIAGTSALADNTPGVTAPNTGDQTADSTTMTISKSKHYPIRWNGEETMAMTSNGTFEKFVQDQFAEGFRTFRNAIEADLAALYYLASRAYGSAGTTPFGTAASMTEFAEVQKILRDNGAPETDLHMVLNTTAMAKLKGTHSELFKVNEAGTEELLRRGIVRQLMGFDLHESAQIKTHTKGTAASYAVDLLAGYAIGDRSLHLDTGTGTHVAGDVITFAGDANKYVINTGAAGDGDKDITLNKPGLVLGLANDALATTGNSYTANMVFHRNAIQFASRLPAMPQIPGVSGGGDMADDRTTVTDPYTGITYELAVYRQYRQVHIELGLAWGQQCIKPEFMALLLG